MDIVCHNEEHKQAIEESHTRLGEAWGLLYQARGWAGVWLKESNHEAAEMITRDFIGSVDRALGITRPDGSSWKKNA